MHTGRCLTRIAVAIGLPTCTLIALAIIPGVRPTAAQEANPDATFKRDVQPLLKKYCVVCHSTQKKKGSLDLERFATVANIRKDLKPWQGMIEQLEAGEMPPKEKPQPTAEEKQQLLAWVHGFLDAEARSRSSDPGFVPLRRLSNAEYDATIRDLTEVDLRPAREFPADGAAGEGFTNAAEALTDISPTLFNKYLSAAKEIADHAVLLPQGFRFSTGKTRRDWTDESTARLRRFYAAAVVDSEGKLPLAVYIAATVRHRDALLAGQVTLHDVAAREKLAVKYLGEIWQALTDRSPSHPLDAIRTHWKQANERDVPALVAEISAWQNVLWKAVPVGSYKYPVGNGFAESKSRQLAQDPIAADVQPIRLAIKPAPGQHDVVLYLAARELLPAEPNASVVWHRPRLEAPGEPPLLLCDYARFGPAFEVNYSSIFARTSEYLTAAREATFDPTKSTGDLAKTRGLDAAFLARWIELLALEPKRPNADSQGRVVPVVTLARLDEKAEGKTWINGWRTKGNDLPYLLTNSSDALDLIPGKAAPHSVLVHPTPNEFVAVAWKSPVGGPIRVTARVTDAHDACGNGVAWWLELRHGARAKLFAEGIVENGRDVKVPEKSLMVERGDQIVLGIDAHRGDHVCDLTDIALTITEVANPVRTWNLAADVADSIHDGNPHADRQGNKDTWSFVYGASRSVPAGAETIPPGSLLAKWRDLAADPARSMEAAKIADRVQALLSGSRPVNEKHPDRIVYDQLVRFDSMLLQGVDLAAVGTRGVTAVNFALSAERFNDADLPATSNSLIEIRLPAALVNRRAFVVEGRIAPRAANRVVQFHALTAPPRPQAAWDDALGVVALPTGAGYRHLLQGTADFRRTFPLFVCFPKVIPTDEAVCLKMFHREDEPLSRLMLDDAQAKQLDRLWREHRFISRQPAAENAYLPQFIGFVTQDQPKAMVAYFESLRPAFRQRAEAFETEEAAANSNQLTALIAFAHRAYRRPLTENEAADLRNLYQAIQTNGAAHDEAFRGVLTRILVAPAFLFRIENAPAGKNPVLVSNWELASRLSYFLWSSPPDDELRTLAAAGRLHDPPVLASQVRRMLKDVRVRSLAIEFGAQWIHVRGFDERKEKNEQLFPTFNANLRAAIYEESIRFFQDLFESGRAVSQILDADYTFLNETLAKHYGIPGVGGSHWRKVDGVRKFGRGGVLGLASVQTQQAGASRTSPILRGNWVVETLLGEKLPRPPANVPKLPDEEVGNGNLSMRQLVERHTARAECAVCHQRIDPIGFALEKYDPIGRLREKDLGGLVVDAKAKLRDGAEFEGMAGLRAYLLATKRNQFTRLFCRRLLGYALGRSVTLADTSLLDRMISELNANDGRVTAAIQTIVRSPQFRMVRGRDFQD